MNGFGKLARWSIAGAVAVAIISASAASAPAAIDKCQAKLAGNSLKLKVTFAKALLKCKNAIRKDQAKNANLSKAADACEKALKAIYGQTFAGDPKPILPEKTKIGKYLASMNKLSDGGTCTEADLEQLGHLSTGINAPGGARGPLCTDDATACTSDADCPAGESCPGSIEFAKAWLVKAEEKLAWKEDVWEVGDSVTLINSAISLTPGPAACVDNKECGTFCPSASSPAAPAGFLSRPNLCLLKPAIFPPCHDHACTLSGGAGAVLQPTGAPIGLAGRKVALEVCRLPTDGSLPVDGGHCVCDATFGLGTCTPNAACTVSGPTGPCGTSPLGLPGTCYPNYLLLINEPARTFQPPPVIPIVPAITACVDQIRSQGWCDCLATDPGIPLNPAFCLDHDLSTGGTCSTTPFAAVSGGLESSCVCASPAGPTCQTSGCLACVNSGTGARCHSGTENSELDTAWTGASTNTDCVDVNTIAFKLLPPAVCINAMGAGLGSCAAPGPPDAGCVMVGGVACLDARGADLTACNADDLLPPSAPTTVPFTTGMAVSTLEDFLATEGVCVAPAANVGRNCMTNPDCDSAVAAGDGVCSGTVLGCGTGPNPEDCSYTAGPGAGISCPLYESSNLAGWSIVGTFPALDGAGGIGDSVLTFTLSCS